MNKRLLTFCLLSLALATSAARGKESPGEASRVVYVLHSGLHAYFSHPNKNHAAESFRDLLVDRGVNEKDVVVLESPFPAATWSNVLPVESVKIYLDAMDPANPVAHDLYRRMDRVLRDRKIDDDCMLVWVGHSAGGQIGMTLSHLAHQIERYPTLSAKAGRYKFSAVITLGTPVGSNVVPRDVTLRHYFSEADSAVSMLSKNSKVVSYTLGAPVEFGPCKSLGENGKVRCFVGVNHHQWVRDRRIVDMVLRETRPDYRPAWRRPVSGSSPGFGLAQLLADALEAETHVSLEDPESK